MTSIYRSLQSTSISLVKLLQLIFISCQYENFKIYFSRRLYDACIVLGKCTQYKAMWYKVGRYTELHLWAVWWISYASEKIRYSSYILQDTLLKKIHNENWKTAILTVTLLFTAVLTKINHDGLFWLKSQWIKGGSLANALLILL